MKKKCNKKLYKITLHRIFLILIILLAVVLRFWRIDEIFDFHELVHLPITINIANNFIDYLHIPILQEKIHGPLSYFLIAPSIYFLGSTLIALKLPFAISGVLAVIFLYLFVRDFYNEEIALLSSFILTILPGHVILSTTPLQWIFNPFFVVLTLYLFYKYSKTGKSIYLYLGAAIAGLGIMVRISFLFFLIPFLLLVTIFKGLSFIKKHSKKLMIASIFFILGGCYPLILLNLDGNIRVISYELKNRFPITKGGIDLRDVKDNLKYGFTYIFPKFLREYTYMTGDFIVKNDEIFNFLNIFLFALMGMLTIGLWTAYQFLRSSSSSHNRNFFFKSHPDLILHTFRKDFFIMICLFCILILTSTLCLTYFYREEYVIASPFIAIIIGKGIYALLKISKKLNRVLFFFIFILIFLILFYSFYPFFDSFLKRSMHPCTLYLSEVAKSINKTNYSIVMTDYIALNAVLQFYGIRTGLPIFALENGRYTVTDEMKDILQEPSGTETVLYLFQPSICMPDYNLREVFREEVIKNNKTLIKERDVIFGQFTYSLYRIV